MARGRPRKGDARARGGGSRRRSPRSPSPPRRPASPSGRDRSGGGRMNGGDSWRPINGRRGEQTRMTDMFSRADDASIKPPQGDFTFRFDKPAGVAELPPPSFDSHRRDNGGPRRDGRDGRDGRGGRGRGGRGGRGGRRWVPPHLSERALLSNSIHNLPEESLIDSDAAAKFRNLDDLTDEDEEQGMDISSDSEADDLDYDTDSQEPAKKRVKTSAATNGEVSNSTPKWSNPDPYTALPCPDETLGKKKDVVALIRKARNDAAQSQSAPPDVEDFIAFGSSSDEGEAEDEPPPAPPPPPRFSLPPPPTQPRQADFKVKGSSLPGAPSSVPHPPTGPKSQRPNVYNVDSRNDLGSRKRTADDEIKPPDYGQLKKANMRPANGAIVEDWAIVKGEPPCPWATDDHSDAASLAFRLHQEVMDFYNFVRPRKFEQKIRENLVENLRRAMRRDGRNFASATVHPFGSFMSELYLPTADMDLVICSASFSRGGPPTYLSAKNWLYKFRKLLTAQKVAEDDAIEVIAHARIPLVKFVDKATGLKVDVSFENLGGVEAVDTFLAWKATYPAMPILVTVIKHFLLMRGLNEPVNGGIGGFSVICLVVSMLQLMPQVQSRNLVPEHHLGEMLLEFFQLYGRNFQYERNAISLTGRRIGYIRKSDVSSLTYRNNGRFSIIDPNNASNDISGGSSNTRSIVARFDEAYALLNERIRSIGEGRATGGILDVILEGNYSSFRRQRDFLRHIHEKTIGPCSD
ncbi:unnamed protein product [Clonostachys rosea f. rosea IK726]|uniref:Uncharacterized protein n=1 Tax=Clonostachys rosea f. rosea IK726 TaxID=1349383 RepID=A0ACA9UNJ1_BIOOC|nr:unnamed protein product [Clonostachys rosea f. rosea IK726]